MGQRNSEKTVTSMTYDLNIQSNVPLNSLTTFRIGGRAKYFIEVKDSRELSAAVEFAKEKGLPIFILGGGSNILVGDKGFGGVVIKFSGDAIEFKKKDGKVLVEAQAGAVWDDLVKEAVERGLYGIECLSGIPGSVGAAPVQNIGAYGQELEDVFSHLEAFDLKKHKIVRFERQDCKFGYRDSVFKRDENKGRYFIVRVGLELNKKGSPNITYNSLKGYLEEKGIDNPDLDETRKAIITLRKKRLEDPGKIANTGSFFKNPIVDDELFNKLKNKYDDMPFFKLNSHYKLFAGWLVEKAGWKGKKYRGAKVSDKHALVITNPSGKAKAKDIKDLSDKIRGDVLEKFGVELEPEVQFVNV